MNGCDWESTAVAGAAAVGHLDIVKWLILNGCDWNSTAITTAEEMHYDEVAKWLTDKRPKAK